jgi:hypothetical protein
VFDEAFRAPRRSPSLPARSARIGGRAKDELTYAASVVNAAAAPAVPEPSTWLAMLVCFGAIGFAMRRRQKTSTRFNFA